jgi:RNA polymerase sigma-70 factor (ECF subfamily)
MQRKDFNQLYNSYLDPIYRFIYFRVGGNSDIAEDLTSEVFMKALEHLDKLDNERSPGAWLYTVARNRLKNHYRDTKQSVDVDDLANVLQGEDGRETFIKVGDESQLNQGLERLSDENRQIITMKHLEGFSYKDIAVVLRKKPGTVRVQAMRAMRELKLFIKA